MSLLRIDKVANGDYWTSVKTYSCDHCLADVNESFPHIAKEEKHYCWECAYINELIDESEYLSCSGIALDNANATIKDGEVIIWVGKIAPWDKSDRSERSSPKYRDWRTSVFERDGYTCQHCHQIGGELNAHHIKPFAKYKDLRFELSNGLTLCVDCHREEHRKR